MPLPGIQARIEQVDSVACLGVDAREVRAFVEIALRATPGEIIGAIVTAVDSGDDVVDVEGPLVSYVR